MSKWNDNIINTIKLIESEFYVKGYSEGYNQAIKDLKKTDNLNIIDMKTIEQIKIDHLENID